MIHSHAPMGCKLKYKDIYISIKLSVEYKKLYFPFLGKKSIVLSSTGQSVDLCFVARPSDLMHFVLVQKWMLKD